MRRAILAMVMIGACAPGASSSPQAAAIPNAVSTPIIRTAVTASGQPLRLPQGAVEMVAAVVEIPPGGTTNVHQHPWSRFVYVERGPVRVVDQDTGQIHEFQTGQAFGEVVAQWHQGSAPGPQGARLIVIDIVPPGVTNMTMR